MLKQGDVVKIAMGLHELPASRRSATEARIKNFLKLRFPDVARVGTGDRTEYSAAHVLQLLIGFELLRFRMPPSVIAAVITSDWAKISRSFGGAAYGLLAIREGASPSVAREFLSIDSLALHESGKTIAPDQLKSSVEVTKAEALADAIGGTTPGTFRSGLILDPSSMLEGVALELPKLRRPIEVHVFLSEVAQWK